jgi:formylglycine-generating enzyme required for sulfatase activity
MHMRKMAGMAIAAILLLAAGMAQADNFGSGGNIVTIDFVAISGATNPGIGIPAGDGFTFTGVANGYRMGTYEITNAQWDNFKANLANQNPPVSSVTGTPSNAYDQTPHFTGTDVPTNCVSWYEAAQFVNWLNTSTNHHSAYNFIGTQGTGGYMLSTWTADDADNGTNLYRHKDAKYYLPTENEWVKAAYWNGLSLQTYANASAGDLVSGLPDPAKWNYDPSVGYEPWNVGSGSEELNGTHDMMGNVWEWMESPVNVSDTTSGRGLRGGAYYNGYVLYLASSTRDDYLPFVENSPVGFRVASEVPEPASLGLLTLGGLALLKRRRR